MFPDYLDGAKVIEYTERSCFAFTVDPWDDENPGSEKEVCYLAICQYENSEEFNFFWCDDDFNVLQDWLCDSIDECKSNYRTDIVWNKK